MPITIIGPSSTPNIRIAGTPLVEIKRLWTEDWEIQPGVRVLNAKSAIAGAEIGVCELIRHYGEVKLPYQNAYVNPPTQGMGPVAWLDYWVRVRAFTALGSEVIWTGRVHSEVREPYGSGDAPSGVQNFVAYEAAMVLERINITDSIWLVGGVEKRLDWIPAMNLRDDRNFVVGNMILSGAEAFYGGSAVWTHRRAVDYLLTNFADAGASQGPGWSIVGQTDLLDDLRQSIRYETGESLLSILRRIINPKQGIDFNIVPTDDGFAVDVFALSAREQSFSGVTLPTNPRTVEIKRSQAKDITAVKITQSDEHSVGRVRVLGARLVACVSQYGFEMEKKWTTAAETAYNSGTGVSGDDAAEHDEARKADHLRDVYQVFGAPADWNHNGGLTAPRQVIENGQLTLSNESAVGSLYQNQARATLSFLPLRANVDYSTTPPTDSSAGLASDLLAPLVWLWDEEAQRYVPADQAGMDVSALLGDWGVFINASPNHLLAKNHFAGAADSAVDPLYDYSRMVITFAFRTDQRMALTFERAGGVRPQDGTMDLIDEDAELWFACPVTTFQIDKDGELKNTPDGQYLILRNDSERLFAIMAGAIARYFYPRCRADLHFNGLFPYSNLIGQILTVIEEGGNSRSIQAPITAVEYDLSAAPRTTIKAGYAR